MNRMRMRFAEQTSVQTSGQMVAHTMRRAAAALAAAALLLAVLGGEARAQAPGNLTLQVQNDTEILLSWTDNSGNEQRFEIFRASSPNGPFNNANRIGVVDRNTTEFLDQNLDPATQYCYQVAATRGSNQDRSGVECATTKAARPSAPSDLEVRQIGVSPSAQLTWDHNASDAGGDVTYTVYRTRPGAARLASVSERSYVDSGLANGTTYCYRVSASNDTGESTRSGEACTTIDIAAAAPPTNVTLVPRADEIRIDWELPIFNYAELIVQRGPAEDGPYTEIARLGGFALNLQDESVIQNTRYCYRLQTVNAVGASPLVGPICATTPFGRPDTPEGESVENIDGSSLLVTWTDIDVADHWYRVERVDAGGRTVVVDDSALVRSIVDSGLVELTRYCYRVRKINPQFQSNFSDLFCGRTGLLAPSAVSALSATPSPEDPTQSVTIAWRAATPRALTTYEVAYRPEGAADFQLLTPGPGADTSAVVTGLDDATRYEIQVTAVRAVDGLRSASAPVATSAVTFMALWPGDANDDGVVDAQDVVFMTQPDIYGQPTSASSTGQTVAWQAYPLPIGPDDDVRVLRSDADRNGRVEVFDFLAVAANAGRTVPGGTAAAPAAIDPAALTEAHRQALRAVLTGFTPEAGNEAQERLKAELTAFLAAADGIPDRVTLAPNYPNPFNPSTTLAFGLPEAGRVQLTIYNALGQAVAVLVDDTLPAGTHRRTLTLTDQPSGLYFAVLRTGRATETHRMVLLK